MDDCPRTELHDLAAVLGDRQEVTRRQQPAFGVTPAHERLHPQDAPGAKLDDLRAAARVLKGRKVARGMRFVVAPASARDQAQAAREGVMDVLVEAGAQVLANTCGACAGYGGSIPEGATVLSSTARNFKGRMGSETAQVYLGSPYAVAAAALTGRIADPRELLA